MIPLYRERYTEWADFWSDLFVVHSSKPFEQKAEYQTRESVPVVSGRPRLGSDDSFSECLSVPFESSLRNSELKKYVPTEHTLEMESLMQTAKEEAL